MPTYSYKCPQCGFKKEVILPILRQAQVIVVCEDCKKSMQRDYKADMPMAGGRRYGAGFVSESLAIHPEQIAEHHSHFPDVEVRGDGCLVFKDTKQHAKYLDKIGWDKAPQKHKRKMACKKS